MKNHIFCVTGNLLHVADFDTYENNPDWEDFFIDTLDEYRIKKH